MIKITPVFVDFSKKQGDGPSVTKDMTKYLYTFVLPELEPQLGDLIDEVKITIKKQSHIIKVSFQSLYKEKEIIIHEEGKDFYSIVPSAAKAFKKNILKQHQKYYSQKKNKRQESKELLKEIITEGLEEQKVTVPTVELKDNFTVEKTKQFAIKPMVIEEAILQMELLGHDFFVFLNAETEEVNVIYKRKNDTYGLIEPKLN